MIGVRLVDLLRLGQPNKRRLIYVLYWTTTAIATAVLGFSIYGMFQARASIQLWLMASFGGIAVLIWLVGRAIVDELA